MDVAATLTNLGVVLQSQDKLGVVLQSQNKLDEAKANLKQALGILKLIHGSTHPDVATVIMNLGNCCLQVYLAHIFVCICMYVYVYVHIYVYTQTFTHIRTKTDA